MKIIITGVAGFIGSNLAEKLLNDGHEIIGIDNFSYGRSYNIKKLLNSNEFSFVEGDVTNASILDSLKGDALVHLASQKIPRYDNSLRTLEENAVMTDNVIKKCLKDDMKLIFASTSDVYGKNPDIPFTENHNLVLGPTVVKRWAYAASKIFSEHKIIANGEANNLTYTIVRFFGSYGINQNLTWWGGPQSVFINKAFENDTIEIHGDGLQTRTFTYVGDTVDALSRCVVDSKANGDVFNIAGNPAEEIAIVDLARTIWELIRPGEEPKLKFIPYSTFGNYEDVRRRVPSIDKICDKLGYAPKHTLKEGLTAAIKWQKEFLEEEAKELS